ncbi:MAG: hypothetical protein ACRC2H_05630 [Silanimonas sp.]
MSTKLSALSRSFIKALKGDKYEKADGGVLVPSLKIKAVGEYVELVNGVEVGVHRNTVVDQGFVDILNTYFGPTAKKSGFFVALFSGAVTPAANWTAANFSSTASEITSGTEGYSEATRRPWSPATATTPVMDNYLAKSTFSIVTAATLNVNGAALLTDSAKGSTAGVLVSAARYPNVRQLQNGDTYEVGYRIVFSAG